MKLGTLTAALGDLPLDEACGFLAGNGVQMVEIGCGGFPGTAHCDAAELLADQGKRREFLDTVHRHGLATWCIPTRRRQKSLTAI